MHQDNMQGGTSMARKDSRGEIPALLETFSVNAYLFQHEVCTRLKLHPTDFLSLHILNQRGPLAAGALSREIGLTSGATTAAVDRLLAAGFVRRISDARDRRRVLVAINEGGIRRLREYYEPIDSFVDKTLAGYSPQGLEAIRRFLRALTGMGRADAEGRPCKR